MEEMMLEDAQKMKCPHCGARQPDDAKYYVVADEMGAASLSEDRCTVCVETFKCWRDEEGYVTVDVIEKKVEVEPITPTERLTEFFTNLKWYQYLFGVVLFTTGFLNIWQSPETKVANEWKACNMVYADRCTYVGTRFQTGEYEMKIAMALHGDVDLVKLRKK